MPTINARSTKAEILVAYQALAAQSTSAADVWQWLTRKGQSIGREVIALVKDCYKAGQWTRRCYDSVKAELSRPIFKA